MLDSFPLPALRGQDVQGGILTIYASQKPHKPAFLHA